MSIASNTLVSVIVPLYNKEQWVERCIKSILNQTYQNMEILIINDGSTDNSCNVVSAINDSRIKIINKPNGGVSSARNLGIDSAEGAYIAFVDADDKWESKHIEFLLKGFEIHKNAAILANKLEERVGNRMQNTLPLEAVNSYSKEDYLLWLSKNLFPIHIGSTMFKKSILDAYDIRFYEHIKMGEDINFMIRVSRLGECILCDYKGLVYYRDDENSAMNSVGKEAALTAQYFYGMGQNKWSEGDQKKIIKFLRLEYVKKAYQNRGLAWREEELLSQIGGGVEIGKFSVLIYLIIRYTPEFIFSFYRWLR